MTVLDIAGGFLLGFVFGAGAVLFYLKWKIGRQIGAMQNEMEDIMDMTSDIQQGDMDWDESVEPDFEKEE